MKVHLTKTFFLILTLVLFNSLINAQINKHNKDLCKDSLDYETALNHLFPQYFLGKANGYALTFRYSPTDEPESQITIFHPKPDTFEVYLYQPVKENINLQFQKIEELKGCVTYQDAIKLIKIEKTLINLTEFEIKEIREKFFNNFRTFAEVEKRTANNNSPAANVLSDGTLYEVWYYGVGNIHLWGEGFSINSKPLAQEPPFIEWMREVYKIVHKK